MPCKPHKKITTAINNVSLFVDHAMQLAKTKTTSEIKKLSLFVSTAMQLAKTTTEIKKNPYLLSV